MNLGQDELLSQLRQMDEYEFEQLVADVWEQRGWETTVTTGSNDRGIDVIAKKSGPFGQKYLIQAKRYSAGNKIGSPDIQQYSSLRRQENNVDAVVVVTTSTFSPQARQTANDLNVKLIDDSDLYKMILDLPSQRFLSDYFVADTNTRTKRDWLDDGDVESGTSGTQNSGGKSKNKNGTSNQPNLNSEELRIKRLENKSELRSKLDDALHYDGFLATRGSVRVRWYGSGSQDLKDKKKYVLRVQFYTDGWFRKGVTSKMWFGPNIKKEPIQKIKNIDKVVDDPVKRRVKLRTTRNNDEDVELELEIIRNILGKTGSDFEDVTVQGTFSL